MLLRKWRVFVVFFNSNFGVVSILKWVRGHSWSLLEHLSRRLVEELMETGLKWAGKLRPSSVKVVSESISVQAQVNFQPEITMRLWVLEGGFWDGVDDNLESRPEAGLNKNVKFEGGRCCHAGWHCDYRVAKIYCRFTGVFAMPVSRPILRAWT